MRKFLLASVATLGTGGMMGAAFAQVPAGAPTQGQTAYPLANPTAFVNNNNNYQAPALPGALANPTPGTIVVHMNGKVQTTFQSEWGSADTHVITSTAAEAALRGNANVAPAGSPGGPPLTITVPAGGGTVTVPSTPLATSLAPPGSARQGEPIRARQLHAALLRRRRDGDERAALRRSDRVARELHRPDQQQHQHRTPAATVHCQRCTCAVPSPTLPARIGASFASAWPMA